MRTFLHKLRSSLSRSNNVDDDVFDTALPIGSNITSDYKIKSYLGKGGFGFTYLASGPNGDVAIKECFPFEYCHRVGRIVGARTHDQRSEFVDIKARFREEARILEQLDHDNIVGGGKLLRVNGTLYIEMELVRGQTLATYISRWMGGFNIDQIQQIGEQVLSAINHLHSKGFLHKDISPDNIVINEVGQAKLIDFGSAASIDSHSLDDPLLVVKAGYSPQEFYRKGAPVGAGSDLYQLGATLRHCVTGQRPIESTYRLMAKAQGRADPIAPIRVGSRKSRMAFANNIDQTMQVLLQDRPVGIKSWGEHPYQNASKHIG